MTGYHTKWTIPDEQRESAEYVEAGTRIALGQAVYDLVAVNRGSRAG